MRAAAPWVLASALALVAAASWRVGVSEAERAEVYEDSVEVLEPLVARLVAQAEQRDTVLLTVTDTVTRVVTRERVVQRTLLDTLYVLTDSSEAELLDRYVASEVAEDIAQDELQRQTLLWGTAWKEAAEGLQLQNEQLRLEGDAWEAAYRGSQSSRWLERAAFVVTVACVAKC